MDNLTRRILVVTAVMFLSGCAGLQNPDSLSGNWRAAQVFDHVKQSPVELHMFLERFPKGGDLHNHLSGAIYAEDFVDWAQADGICFDFQKKTAVSPPCDNTKGLVPLRSALASGLITRDEVIDAWSLRNYVPGYSASSRHDQFFQTFGRFNAAGNGHSGDMLTEVVRHAADQNILYLELMVSPEMEAARALARRIGPQKDMDALYTALMTAGIELLVPKASTVLGQMRAVNDQRLGCPQSQDPACKVQVRFLAQVIRTFPPEQVFAQSLLAFLLTESDHQVVGLNLVAPEDNQIALETYETQMRQLDFLAKRRGPVPVTLHAGELTLGLVHPRYLRNHIRQAIEVAGARRIGHGVSISYEHNAEQLLTEMAQQNVVVEINLTSNAQILGVEGNNHPFRTYRKYGVPLTLSTDDEGVSRGSLTHEYERAVTTYDLQYFDLVTLSRNALSYAFVAGDSLWAKPRSFSPVPVCTGQVLGSPTPDQACAAFLAGSEKASLQWQLEGQLTAFDVEPSGLGRKGP